MRQHYYDLALYHRRSCRSTLHQQEIHVMTTMQLEILIPEAACANKSSLILKSSVPATDLREITLYGRSSYSTRRIGVWSGQRTLLLNSRPTNYWVANVFADWSAAKYARSKSLMGAPTRKQPFCEASALESWTSNRAIVSMNSIFTSETKR